MSPLKKLLPLVILIFLTTPLFSSVSADKNFTPTPLIIGGQVTQKFPATVGMETCSGTIISPRAVITADHCSYRFKKGPIIKGVYSHPLNTHKSMPSQYDIAVVHYRQDRFKAIADIDIRPVEPSQILDLVGTGYDRSKPAMRSKRWGVTEAVSSPYLIDFDERYPVDQRVEAYELLVRKNPNLARGLFLKTWCVDYSPIKYATSAPADSGGSIYRNEKLVGVISGGMSYSIQDPKNPDLPAIGCESGINAPLALPENVSFLRELNEKYDLGIRGLDD